MISTQTRRFPRVLIAVLSEMNDSPSIDCEEVENLFSFFTEKRNSHIFVVVHGPQTVRVKVRGRDFSSQHVPDIEGRELHHEHSQVQ
jgi:hypothetical protein